MSNLLQSLNLLLPKNLLTNLIANMIPVSLIRMLSLFSPLPSDMDEEELREYEIEKARRARLVCGHDDRTIPPSKEKARLVRIVIPTT